MRFVVVTGTGTGVGKTVTAAALAVTAGGNVAVVKPVQTGVAAEGPGDCAEVARLSGVTDVHELVRLTEPLAPETAARRAGMSLPGVAQVARRIAALDADTVIVEGAGGVRVRLDTDGCTLLDLATDLEPYGGVQVVVVASCALGTLSVTELTVEAVRAAGLTVAGIVIGSWPAQPDLAARCNREDLPRLTGAPLLAVLPEGCGRWPREAFRAAAPGWFAGGYAAAP